MQASTWGTWQSSWARRHLRTRRGTAGGSTSGSCLQSCASWQRYVLLLQIGARVAGSCALHADTLTCATMCTQDLVLEHDCCSSSLRCIIQYTS